MLVAVAAALWGTRRVIRRPLAQSTERRDDRLRRALVLVAITFRSSVAALVAVCGPGRATSSRRSVIGAGSSARRDDPVHAGVRRRRPRRRRSMLQKVQPLVAVVGARVVLGERPRPRFALYLVPALAGAWLIGVPEPLQPTSHGAQPTLYALAAAVLWALGTVLGRYLVAEDAIRARRHAALHVRPARERDRVAGAGRAGIRLGARHVLDRDARARHRRFGARPLLLRPADHAGRRRDARGARVPDHRGGRRLLQVRSDAHRMAVGRCRR